MPKKRSYNPFEVQNRTKGSNSMLEMEYGDGFDDVDVDDDDYNDYNDNGNGDDGEEDFVPLVKSSTSTLPFEIENLRSKRQQRKYKGSNSRSYNRTRVIVVMIIACIFLLPFMFGISKKDSNDEGGEQQQGGGGEKGESSNGNENDISDGSDGDGEGVDEKNDFGLDIHEPTDEESCDRVKFTQSFQDMIASMESNHDDDDNFYCDGQLMKRFGADTCRCPNPLIGQPIVNTESYKHIGERWQKAFDLAKERIANSTSLPSGVDVAFVGDSIVEHWVGYDLGGPSKKFINVTSVYNELFTRAGGGDIDGVVVGIAAQRCRNVLYQFQNDMLIPSFQPKIFWVLVGTNDLGGDYCTVEATVSGIIAIVEEIQKQRPESIVVVNSILPRPNVFIQYITNVNERLECYTEMKDDSVQFFDATRLFMKDDGTFPYYEDGLHPTAKGHRRWGYQIVDKVKELTSN